ncbi:MAG: hypothetical protein ACFFCZ_13385 [Promethearchaeota archaeon]
MSEKKGNDSLRFISFRVNEHTDALRAICGLGVGLPPQASLISLNRYPRTFSSWVTGRPLPWNGIPAIPHRHFSGAPQALNSAVSD